MNWRVTTWRNRAQGRRGATNFGLGAPFTEPVSGGTLQSASGRTGHDAGEGLNLGAWASELARSVFWTKPPEGMDTSPTDPLGLDSAGGELANRLVPCLTGFRG
jgi:hypothetical protein